MTDERIIRQGTVHEVFAQGDWLTAEQINALQAVPPGNKAQPASDWKRRGHIFAVTFDGTEYFAAYQFDTMCQPLPVIRDILAALGPTKDGWKIAAWFHFPNGWIADHAEGEPVAPKDALDRHTEVIEAAQHIHDTYSA